MRSFSSLPADTLLQTFMDAVSDGIFVIIPEGEDFRLVEYKRLFSHIPANNLEKQVISKIFNETDALWLRHHLAKAIHKQEAYCFTASTALFHGKEQHVQLCFSPLVEHGKITAVICAVQQSAESERQQSESKSHRDRYSIALEYAPYGVCFIGADRKPTMLNRSLCRLMNRPRSYLLTQQVPNYIHGEDRPLFVKALEKVISGKCNYRDIEVRLASNDEEGGQMWAAVSMSQVTEDADRVYVILQFANITKRKLMEQQLVQQATHDHLTGLSNRMVFDDALRTALGNARRYHRHGAVLFIDMDDFKSLNDKYGHKAGDTALQEVGKTLRKILRETDIISRIGGDEFAVIMDEVDEEEARHKASLVEKALNSICITAHGKDVDVHASVGYHLFDGSHELNSSEDVIAKADRSMYANKEAKTRNSDTPLDA